MDTVDKQAGLKPTQEKFLAGLLAGKGFNDLIRELGMTRANGALLLEKLRDRGLIVHQPSMPNRRRVVSELDKAGAVLWFDYPLKDVPDAKRLDPRYTGPGRWAVVAMPIPRHERADLRPDRWMVAVTGPAPFGEFAFIASDRDRLSYNLVDRELWRAYGAAGRKVPAGWSTTVRIVTESVADAMGVQVVLPVEFIRDQEAEDDGGNDTGAEDAGAGGGSGSS